MYELLKNYTTTVKQHSKIKWYNMNMKNIYTQIQFFKVLN